MGALKADSLKTELTRDPVYYATNNDEVTSRKQYRPEDTVEDL